MQAAQSEPPQAPAPLLTPEEEKRLVTWAQSEYKKMKASRASIERQWYLNMAFYYGKQNVQFIKTALSSTGFALQTPKAPPWRVRLIVNKIRPMIRTEIAKLTSQRPRFTVVPASTEDQDIMAARVSEQIFDSVYAGYNLRHSIRRAMWWTTVCGTGYLKNYWDPDRIDKVNNLVGDFCIEPITPFHIFVPDLREEEIEQQPYLIHASTKSVEWIKRTYGELLKDTAHLEGNQTSANEILEDVFLNLIGSQSHATKNQVLCLEVWIKPGGHSAFPEGGMMFIVGDQLMQVSRQYPYKHQQYPFAKFDHIPSGKFYGTSIIEDLIPLQREYNRTRSQIIEAKNRMSKPQLMAPKGSVDPSKITNEPGQVILYVPGFNPPTPVPLQPLPQYVIEELNRTQSDMEDIAGQHEITRGKNPAQVTAATALSFLQEQDDTKLSGTIESLEGGIEKIGMQILYYVSQFWDVPRLVRVVGDDNVFEAAEYTGQDLGNNFDVRVESGSALPTSKAAKQAFLMDLMKMGFIPPEQGLELLELGGIEKVYDEYLVDVRQAQRENQKMAQGMQLPPNTWDTHEAHIAIHNKYRKSEKFEQLPDEIKVLFEQHVQLHEATLADQQAQMPPEEGGDPSEQEPQGPPPSPEGAQ